MVSYNNCPLCSSFNITSHLECTDHLLSREKFVLYKCKDCGFIFTQNHPDETEIKKYYESDDYISHNDAARGFINHIYALSRRVMLRWKLKMVKDAARIKSGKILDIGCGTGYFANIMKSYGWDVTGIEPNIKAREFGKNQFGLNIIDPSEIKALPEGSFDVVTMWHVMEHFQDPYTYYRDILRFMKPGGICITALPNCNSFDAEYYGKHWAAWDVPRHLWHFSPATYNFFTEKTGFVITQIRSLPLDVFYISILSEKNAGAKFYFIKGVFRGFIFTIRSLISIKKNSSLIYFQIKNN